MTCHLATFAKILTIVALLATASGEQTANKCKEDMMHMTQGHFNITSQNYQKFKQNHKTYVLSITDSKCPSCCQIQETLKSLKDYLDSSKFYKGKQIKLARINLSNMGEDEKLLQKMGLRVSQKSNVVVPSILVYKGGQFAFISKQYNTDMDRIIHYINRVLHPFVKLETEDEIERFLAFYRLYPEDNPFIKFKGQKKTQQKLTHGPNIDTQMDLSPAFYQSKGVRTRVIAFFQDITEFKDEYKEFKRAANELVQRDDLRIGLVTDIKLIEEVYKKHRYEWFGEIYKTSLIIKRYDSSIEMLDFTTAGHSMKAWINRKSLNPIQDYTYQKQKIMDLLGMPIFGAFVDARKNSLHEIASKTLIEDLKELSLYLKNQFILTYFNGHQQDHLRVRFGIKHRKVPAIGIHYYDHIKQGQAYPYDNDFSQMRIKNWVNNVMKGNIKSDV